MLVDEDDISEDINLADGDDGVLACRCRLKGDHAREAAKAPE
jgi:hypothetical protein